MIFLPLSVDRFYVDPTLKIGVRSNVPVTTTSHDAAVVGHGQTSPTVNEMSRIPYYANLTTDGTTNSCHKTASTLFCATGTGPGVLCPGDTGSGIFTHTNGIGKVILVYYYYKCNFLSKYVQVLINHIFSIKLGIISSISDNSCIYKEKPQTSKYTAVGLYEEWIQTLTGVRYY